MRFHSLSLANRLLLFFMAALVVVLCGFSLVLYGFAYVYLHRQVADRLDSASNTLIAAVEVTPEGVEWEPSERLLSIADGPMGGRVDWLISTDQAKVIDRSSGATAGGLIDEAASTLTARQQPAKRFTWEGQRWQIGQRWIYSDPSNRSNSDPRITNKTDGVRYPALAVTVGIQLDPMRSALRWLAIGLVTSSVLVSTIAVLIGRWICRKALAPVSRVAMSAEAMTATDLGESLPRIGSGDELDALIDSFNGLLNRANEALARQKRFTGDASHQLRTPLTAILGQIEVGLRRSRSTDEYERILAAVQNQAIHLRKIVEALLFLARADEDAQLPGREPLDLAEWVRQYAEVWKDHPRATDLKIMTENNVACLVSANPVLLSELFGNLADNAAKYSSPDTPITISVRRLKDRVTLSVEDQGCGISSDELLHLFDPFYRSPDARRRTSSGVGLGLTIAARLARAMDAKIDVVSSPGTGSRFVVTFPTCDEPTAQAESHSSEMGALSSELLPETAEI